MYNFWLYAQKRISWFAQPIEDSFCSNYPTSGIHLINPFNIHHKNSQLHKNYQFIDMRTFNCYNYPIILQCSFVKLPIYKMLLHQRKRPNTAQVCDGWFYGIVWLDRMQFYLEIFVCVAYRSPKSWCTKSCLCPYRVKNKKYILEIS